MDVLFNHRLANPDEWQMVKPIAAQAVYIPIVSLFWDTRKKKKRSSWHREERPTRRKANKILRGNDPILNWPQLGNRTPLTRRFFLSRSCTQIHPTANVFTALSWPDRCKCHTIHWLPPDFGTKTSMFWPPSRENTRCSVLPPLRRRFSDRAEAPSGCFQHLDSSPLAGFPAAHVGEALGWGAQPGPPTQLV